MTSIVNVLVAANTGIIIFFSGVITPIIFKTLPPEFASKYLRAFFPRLYLTLFVTTLAATFVADDMQTKIFLGIVAVGFLFSFWPLTPAINKATDARQITRFRVLHALSVGILFAQLAVFIYLLI